MIFTNLKVWNEAKDLVKKVYTVSEKFPDSEKYEMVKKIRSASHAAPTNIAKGITGFRADDLQFYLNHARKNLSEIGSILLVAETLGYVEQKTVEEITNHIDDCQKLIYGFIRYKKATRDAKKSEEDAAIEAAAA